MKAECSPVDFIAPDGVVRLYLLKRAGCVIVPFSAVGDSKNRGWWRFSVGAVSLDDIRACLPRLRDALRPLGG